MQRAQRIEFRVTDLEKKDWSEAAGGVKKMSSWARAVLNAECARLRGEEIAHATTGGVVEIIPPARVIPPIAQDASLSIAPDRSQPVSSGAKSGQEQCPRWHTHRSGVYCSGCKKVVK